MRAAISCRASALLIASGSGLSCTMMPSLLPCALMSTSRSSFALVCTSSFSMVCLTTLAISRWGTRTRSAPMFSSASLCWRLSALHITYAWGTSFFTIDRAFLFTAPCDVVMSTALSFPSLIPFRMLSSVKSPNSASRSCSTNVFTLVESLSMMSTFPRSERALAIAKPIVPPPSTRYSGSRSGSPLSFTSSWMSAVFEFVMEIPPTHSAATTLYTMPSLRAFRKLLCGVLAAYLHSSLLHDLLADVYGGSSPYA